MRKSAIIITAILLIISIVNCLRITSQNNIRTVEIISIFAVGVLTGILITQIIIVLKNKK